MRQVDVVIIGSGPAGQKAAVQAAKGGKSVALIERDQWLGGACVHRGTIPSKTLRENALRVKKMRENSISAEEFEQQWQLRNLEIIDN
ncbi:FAD-dependent oxidoreductase, partial [Oleiphilus sp. HI0086]|uniref:FAD-dependent oxidoreductase n=1 Tax=Oleiphilus sp. HI0086 TaxID=1822260 RepID=UPI000A6CBEDC